MYSEEGGLLINMGVEGVHHTMVDGVPVYTDFVLNNSNGLSPKDAVGTFSIAMSVGPFILSQSAVTQIDDESVIKAKEECIIPFLEHSRQYVLPGYVTVGSQEDAVCREAVTDIEIYVAEMVGKFISGRESLDNWDAYVSKVESMGIREVLGIYQEALDAWNEG